MKKFLALSLSYVAFIMLINVKMPTTVGILTFMSMINFVLDWVELGKSFKTFGPGVETVCYCLSVRMSTLCMLGNFSCFCCMLLTFFQKVFHKHYQEYQMVWIQMDILSVLFCVQTVCKGYQQTAKVAASKERVEGECGWYKHGWKFSGLFLNSGFWGWLSTECQPQNAELRRSYQHLIYFQSV